MSDFLRFETESFYWQTRLPVEEAATLPPIVYRSPEYFAREQERLFGTSWVCVGYTSQVDEPGKAFPVTVAGQPIFIVRDKDRRLRAFYNVCRHRGSQLVTGPTRMERVRCPYHGWTYDLRGTLERCPLFVAEDSGNKVPPPGVQGFYNERFRKEDYGLLPIRVEAWGCFLFVTLNMQAPPLAEFLGDLVQEYAGFPLDELVLVRRKRYDIKANWKLVAENFLEYYHLPWVHPELCTVTAPDLHKRNQGAGMYMSFYASPLLRGGTAIDADYLPAMPGLPEKEANSGYFPLVFPNLALFLLPHHCFALLMFPTSEDTTEEYGDVLVHPSVVGVPDAEKKIDEMLAFYDMVNLQDVKAVELVQKGVQARAYTGGRMNYRFEEPVHRFQNMVIDHMVGRSRIPEGDAPPPVGSRAQPATSTSPVA